VRFGGSSTVGPTTLTFVRCFAQRAFCAMLMRRRAAADMVGGRVPLLVVVTVPRAAKAASMRARVVSKAKFLDVLLFHGVGFQ
jgi:hypothetical protein